MNVWTVILKAGVLTCTGDSFSAKTLEEMAKKDDNLRYNTQTQSLEMNMEIDIDVKLPKCLCKPKPKPKRKKSDDGSEWV